MNAIRLGVCFVAIGIALLVLGAIEDAQEDLLHIGGVGCIVFGAVAICIATEAKSNGVPPRAKQDGRPRRAATKGDSPAS